MDNSQTKTGYYYCIQIIVFIFLLTFHFSTFGKPDLKKDSLLNLLGKAKQDSSKINLLIKLGGNYTRLQYDSAQIYFTKAITLSQNISDKNYLAKSLMYSGLSQYENDLSDSALATLNKSLKIFKENKNFKMLGECYIYIGNVYVDQGLYEYGIENFNLSISASASVNDKSRIAQAQNNIGNIYCKQGIYDKGMIYFMKSLTIKEELNDKKGMLSCYNNIGYVQWKLNALKLADEYYHKTLKLALEVDDKRLIAGSYNNLGLVSFDNNKIEEALEYHKKALAIRENTNDKKGIAQSYNNIASIYRTKKMLSEALKYAELSLNYRKESNDIEGITKVLPTIAGIYNDMKQYRKAIEISNECLVLAKNLGAKIAQRESYGHIIEAWEGLKDYKKAFEYSGLYKDINDSIFNENSSKQIKEAEAKYNSEKKQREIEKQQLMLNNQETEIKRQQTVRNALTGGFILVVLLAFVIFRSYRQKKKDNILLSEQKHEIQEKNEELNQQNEEIAAQRDNLEILNSELTLKNEEIFQQKEEITTQRDEIEAQRDLVITQKKHIEKIHLEVSQSIDYAKRIQTSILPDDDLLKEKFDQHFILFKPKDKVSGDFYWLASVEGQTIITVADCTGHGVPGAFMSMLGTSFLREIVQKEYITNPAIILRRLRKEIIKALKQKGESGEQKDGMDMAIISINHETNILQFSGANHSLYILSEKNNSEQEQKIIFNELKGDKMPVAIYEDMQNFSNKEIQINKGDRIYLHSDGYVDQFGGPNGKKFMTKKFKQLLTEVFKHDMTVQFEILNKTIEEWKISYTEKYDQTDDITIMGIKI